MITTDPIADFLTRIRNAQKAQHEVVSIPASKVKIAMTVLLKQEGFIRAYKCIRDGKQGIIKIALKYKTPNQGGGAVIRTLERVSKPGRRYYVDSRHIPFVKNGYGVGILSTSRGLMTCRDARRLKLGGEYLCRWY